jgi:2-dehydro-3-deoxyphosphogluconate aldolase/(4S)-4-hydroxy-2-oxoglutarate aldolase
MPTGGVSADNLHEWSAAGVVAVGAGSELCSAADIQAGRFDAIEARARQFTEARSGVAPK